MAAPMVHKNIATNSDPVSFYLILAVYTILLIEGNCHQAGPSEGFLLCRKCGAEVGKHSDHLVLPSSKALRRRNETLADKHKVYIQLFQNPYDVMFELITTSTAEVERASDKYSADSWFPGFVWSLIFCPRCGAHLGWWFDAMTEVLEMLEFKVTSFVGLILEKIMHEDEESNLIAMPKSYMS